MQRMGFDELREQVRQDVERDARFVRRFHYFCVGLGVLALLSIIIATAIQYSN